MPERALRGWPASAGVAVGPVWRLVTEPPEDPERAADDPDEERPRLAEARAGEAAPVAERALEASSPDDVHGLRRETADG